MGSVQRNVLNLHQIPASIHWLTSLQSEGQELSIITVIIAIHSDRSEHLWITDGKDSSSSASPAPQKAVLGQVLQRCKSDT